MCKSQWYCTNAHEVMDDMRAAIDKILDSSRRLISAGKNWLKYRGKAEMTSFQNGVQRSSSRDDDKPMDP